MKAIFLTLILITSCTKNEKTVKRIGNSEKSIEAIEEKTQNPIERRDHFEALKKSKGMGEKLTAAYEYFESFRLREWSEHTSEEHAEVRGQFLLTAATELTLKLQDLSSEINLKNMGPLKAGLTQQDEMNFYALAANLHVNGSLEKSSTIKRKPEAELSFYEIIQRALIREHNQEHLEEYEEVIVNGDHKKMYYELLKARVNILAAMALNNLTDKSKKSILQKTQGWIFWATKGFLGAVDLPETFDESNEATKKFTISYLERAVETKQLLQELSVEVKIEKTVRSAFSNMDLEVKNKKTKEESEAYDPQREEVKYLVNRLLQ